MKKPVRLARRTVYRSDWLDLHLDRVRYPSGRVVPVHHVIDFFRPASAAVVVDARGRVLFVRSYRYVTDQVQWELPAGRSEPGETPERTAEREVREESGYETTGHRLLYTYHPMNGIANQVFHIVICRAGRRAGAFDPDEVAGRKWVSRAAIRRMLRRGDIHDGFSLAGLLLFLSSEPRWSLQTTRVPSRRRARS